MPTVVVPRREGRVCVCLVSGLIFTCGTTEETLFLGGFAHHWLAHPPTRSVILPSRQPALRKTCVLFFLCSPSRERSRLGGVVCCAPRMMWYDQRLAVLEPSVATAPCERYILAGYRKVVSYTVVVIVVVWYALLP